MTHAKEWLWIAGITITTFLIAQLVVLLLMSTGQGVDNRYLLIAAQVLSLILMFGLSAFCLRKKLQLSSHNEERVPHQTQSLIGITLLAILITILIQPAIGFTAHWNEQIHLPQWLHGVEQWMRQSEAAAKALTDRMMVMNHGADLLLLIVGMGIVPGIVEEYYFRGMIQPLILRQTGNPHIAVWTTAILFSALHMQFLGFIPRLLLALFFGYMVCNGKAPLWLAMTAHAVNNTLVVILEYLVQHHLLNPTTMTRLERGEPYGMTLLCTTIAVVGLFLLFHKQRPPRSTP